MKKFIFLCPILLCEGTYAEPLNLTTALQNTYRNCVNLDDELHDLKVLAGINTVVTAVGTGVGVGAVATGFAKERTDKEIAEMEKYLQELNVAAQQQTDEPTRVNITDDEIHALFADEDTEYITTEQEMEKLTKKSKNLGNWRTGLIATNTATNIAGAIIANKSKVNKDLQTLIDKCIDSVKELNNSIVAAKMNNEDITEAQQIYAACREYEYIDLSPINKRATGAMVATSVGAVVGGVGTITSGVANSDKIRNDNTDAGKKKEKDLNTASNVLAIGATAASATATVFNATQIAAIKKVAKISEACTGVLK